MKFTLLSFSGNRDTVLEKLFLHLAGSRAERNTIREYPLRIIGDLQGVLPWIDDEDHPEKIRQSLSLYRIYLNVFENSDRILIAGPPLYDQDELQLKYRGSEVSLTNVEIIESCQDDEEWGLIAVVLEGWIVLFDEDLENGIVQSLTEEVMAARCPGREEYLDRMVPSMTTDRTLWIMAYILLESLPADTE